MKVTNVSARAYTIRGVVIAPGASAEVPDEAKADLKGLEQDLKTGAKAAADADATADIGGEKTSTEEANTSKITPHPGKKG